MKLSIVTPAFNEAENLGALYQRIAAAMSALGIEWEWIVVDDHSRDRTFALIGDLAIRDGRVRGLRLSRNSGSHVAITCGLHHAQGDAAAIMAADLQDTPETLGPMLDRWRQGAQIVWAVRRERPGDRTHAGFAAFYYWMMRRLAGLKEMPARGADFFLADRVVLDAFKQFPERNVSVLALFTSLGFRQEFVEYDKQPRAAGQSGWTLGRKIGLVVDSLTAFSPLPIRLCSYAGAALGVLGVLIGVLGIARLPDLGGGILLLLAAIVGLGGVQLLALGVLGEYLWRTLEEARRRPQYLVEAMAGHGSPANPSNVR
jgi:glycosyltransferase involved in cell wall biosynthesis